MLGHAFRMTAAAALLFASSAAYADGELHLYNWGDYTNPKLIEKFEQQHNVKVTLDDYDSNDTLLAKVRAGNTGYDVVFPSDYAVQILLERGLPGEDRAEQDGEFQECRSALGRRLLGSGPQLQCSLAVGDDEFYGRHRGL